MFSGCFLNLASEDGGGADRAQWAVLAGALQRGPAEGGPFVTCLSRHTGHSWSKVSLTSGPAQPFVSSQRILPLSLETIRRKGIIKTARLVGAVLPGGQKIGTGTSGGPF